LLVWNDPQTGLSQVQILKKDPFSSEKKRMGCAVRDRGDNSVRVHWKGASEIVLGLCNRKMGQDGRVR
jgi:Ca2+-transporting ATPase